MMNLPLVFLMEKNITFVVCYFFNHSFLKSKNHGKGKRCQKREQERTN